MSDYKIVGCADEFYGCLCAECGNKLDDDACKRFLKTEGGYYLYKKIDD